MLEASFNVPNSLRRKLPSLAEPALTLSVKRVSSFALPLLFVSFLDIVTRFLFITTMATMKRQRSFIDDEDTEIIEVESAQSSLQQASVRSFLRSALVHHGGL